MADIRSRAVQVGQAVILAEASERFEALNEALASETGTRLDIKRGYLSKYEVVDGLRLSARVDGLGLDSEQTHLFDPSVSMQTLVEEGSFDKLMQLVDGLSFDNFEPPLLDPFDSVVGQEVWESPTKLDKDPHRTGRLFEFSSSLVSRGSVSAWIYNNSILYGFVIYGDRSLYYLGVDLIKKRLSQNGGTQEALKSVVGSYIRDDSKLGPFTTTPQTLNNTTNPAPSGLQGQETIPHHTTLSNDKRVLELVVLDDRPVWSTVAAAYIPMRDQAAKEGVQLKVVSGFRPGFGANEEVATSKGRKITMTTQETIRRDKSRWIASERSKYGSDEDFIFKAGASAYNPATARPGTSNHGGGIAIDLNVGGRNNFQPLNTAVYVWLVKNAHKFGFIRTVSSEEWHWEYRPTEAKNGPYAAVPGTNGNKFYTDLGLAKGQFQF